MEADSQSDARDIAEEHISEGFYGWVVDEMAGWIETGDIEEVWPTQTTQLYYIQEGNK